MNRSVAGVLFLIALSLNVSVSESRNFLKLPSEGSRFFDADEIDSVGTRWAILLAGSNGYWNYRHQVIIRFICYCFFFTLNILLLKRFFCLFVMVDGG